MTARDVVATNRLFYERLWRKARLESPDRFNTWPLVSQLMPSAPDRLEIGPGLRPRLPIANTHFIDIAPPAVEQLNARGGFATLDAVGTLTFPDRTFDLVCAFDIIEHIEDDGRLLAEVSRVLKDGGVLICSVPLHADLWTEFDTWVGHARRYDPVALLALLSDHGLTVERSAVFGMQPTNPRWIRYGMWWLERYPDWAMFWYNWVGLPLAIRFQKPLALANGLIDTARVDEVLLVCRRRARGTR